MDRRVLIAQLAPVLALAEQEKVWAAWQKVGANQQLWLRAALVQDMLAPMGCALSLYCTPVHLQPDASASSSPNPGPSIIKVPAAGEMVTMDSPDQSPHTRISLLAGPFGEPAHRILPNALAYLSNRNQKPLDASHQPRAHWAPAKDLKIIPFIRTNPHYAQVLAHLTAMLERAVLAQATLTAPPIARPRL